MGGGGLGDYGEPKDLHVNLDGRGLVSTPRHRQPLPTCGLRWERRGCDAASSSLHLVQRNRR